MSPIPPEDVFYMWYCCRCGDRMEHSASRDKVTKDRDAHLKNCPHKGTRAPWELNITSNATFVSAYSH